MTNSATLKFSASLLVAFGMSACSFLPSSEIGSNAASSSVSPLADNSTFLSSGSVVISRAMPAANPLELASLQRDYGTLLGYVPLSGQTDSERWLEFEKSTSVLRLMEKGETVAEVTPRGRLDLPAGRYEVMSVAENPLWYADDQYFLSRHLPLPEDGSTDRYLAGALGQSALFINDAVAIHSSVIWSEDVGGLQLSRAEISSLLPQVSPGLPFFVKN